MDARLALIGGEEFSPGFEAVHASLLADLGLRQPHVVFLPTCAADDGEEAIEYWCTTAQTRLAELGAHVDTPRIIDAASADDPDHARLVAEADWVYLGGGYPHVAMRILPNTRALAALHSALKRGALISGASGGAMLMGVRSSVVTPELAGEIGRVWEHGAPPDWNPPRPTLIDCLDLVPHASVSPHFNRVFSARWLTKEWVPTGSVVIGLDEQTALVRCADGRWEVRGQGAVTVFDSNFKSERYLAGARFRLNEGDG
ncbi:MAG: Type 1 glutamine amidotransferase-like domain-containing protein [Chloroflexi bacterium]|nr:Type 1 glutamine amidotransferase-like domain-containing protein [Chloroflexota bacterium]